MSFALVAYGGYDTVRRLPLLWGVVVGATLAGVTSMVSLAIGNYVLNGRFGLPEEAEPLLLLTTLLMTSLIGGIIGGAVGVVARSRRRHRARRTAIRKLAYMATDDEDDKTFEMPVKRTAAEMQGDRLYSRAAERR